jgi:hypothetical protein
MRLEAIFQLVIGSLAGCGMLLAVLAVEASEGSALAFHPVEIDGSDATVGNHALELVGPDVPQAPTLWEGPIRVRSKGHLRCTLDAELIAGLYAHSAGRALLVVSQSGTNTYLNLLDLKDRARRDQRSALHRMDRGQRNAGRSPGRLRVHRLVRDLRVRPGSPIPAVPAPESSKIEPGAPITHRRR